MRAYQKASWTSSATSKRPAARIARNVAAVDGPSTSQHALSKYAVIEHGGVRQWVTEGQVYAAPKELLKAHHAADRSHLSFTRVVAVRADGTFSMGEPYLDQACVDAELLDEFLGPVAANCTSIDGRDGTPAACETTTTAAAAATATVPVAAPVMARFRVTRITGPALP